MQDMLKSIMQEKKECYLCKSTNNLHLHHVFYGNANRRLSDKDGCYIYLCADHHIGAKGIHNNDELNREVKKRCQIAWEDYYGRTTDDFIKRYGRSFK